MPDFDVAVIGGGSAGCVVAHELAESSEITLCMVEAGPDYGPMKDGKWPSDLLDARKTSYSHDWGYNANISGENGPSIDEQRAKVVGGCSSHNQCGAMWGLPDDYDAWSMDGWTYSEVKPMIDTIEKVSPQFATPYRGRNGLVPTKCALYNELDSWQKAFFDSVRGSGYPVLSDLSSPDPSQGVMPFHANIKDNIRWNSSFAFLDLVRQNPKLTILSNTTAEEIVFAGDRRASGIFCKNSQNGKSSEITAKVIVLSAGVYGSPLLLMRSGIGPKQHLQDLGRTCRVDLPGVGSNLQEHPGIFVQYEPSETATKAVQSDLASGNYWGDQIVFRAASNLSDGPFDLHLDPFRTRTDPASGWIPSTSSGQNPGEWVFGVLIENVRPLSRGTVRLRGLDPTVAPDIDFNFFSDPDNRDLSILLKGVETLRRLSHKADGPIARYARKETKPGPHAEPKLSSAKQWVGQVVTNYSHACGTCRMANANDSNTVVDAQGKVRQVHNVYVADASTIPRIPRAGINFTCMMIGKRIASNVRRLLSPCEPRTGLFKTK